MVLVPGAFAGAWMWRDVVERLADAGIEALVVELPTYGERAQGKTFANDVAAVTGALGHVRSVVLAAHSYGGVVMDLPAGHCPQWSRPDLLADLLGPCVRAAGDSS